MDKQVAFFWKSGIFALGSVALAAGLTLSTPSTVKAQAAYGSYLGAGAAFGVTNGGGTNENSTTSAFVATRYKFLKVPVSLRSQVLIGGSGLAVVPVVSYDFPINWQTDVYIGAGASIVQGTNTPIGNRGSFVLQPGIDYALPNSSVSLFWNAIVSLDGYQSSGTSAVSIQAGAGLRF